MNFWETHAALLVFKSFPILVDHCSENSVQLYGKEKEKRFFIFSYK